MEDLASLENIITIMEKDTEIYQDVVKKKLLSKRCLCLFPAGVGSRSMIE